MIEWKRRVLTARSAYIDRSLLVIPLTGKVLYVPRDSTYLDLLGPSGRLVLLLLLLGVLLLEYHVSTEHRHRSG